MKIRIALLVCLMALTAGISAPLFAWQEETLPGDMAMTGEWHGAEVAAEDGETWLALVQEKTGYFLREVAITVEIVEDEIIDVSPAKTGKKITGPQGVEPLVLLRNVPQLKPGPVEAADLIDKSFDAGKPTAIYFDGLLFELELKCAEEHRGKDQADCPLQLSGGGSRQALQSYPVYRPCTGDASIASDAFPQVLWAGDLDRDGRLDLLVDLTDHYNVAAPTLLLSSLAQPDELVRPAAVFRTTGC